MKESKQTFGVICQGWVGIIERSLFISQGCFCPDNVAFPSVSYHCVTFERSLISRKVCFILQVGKEAEALGFYWHLFSSISARFSFLLSLLDQSPGNKSDSNEKQRPGTALADAFLCAQGSFRCLTDTTTPSISPVIF